MKSKEIRKWMRQFVLNELYGNSESRNEDLIKVEKGRITKIHDIVALGLKEYIKATAKGVIGLNISEIGLSAFKREFLKSDEDIKTTLLYGFVTQKSVPFDKEEDYVLGKEREGGFKMVNLNLERINQDDIIDTSDEFDEYIEEMQEEEEERARFSEKTKDVATFISKTDETNYIRLKRGKQHLYMTGGGKKYRKKGDKPSPMSVDRVRIKKPLDYEAKTRGGTKNLYIKFPDKKSLDRTLASISPESRENLLNRLEQVGDAYQVRMVSAADIYAEYEALSEQLNEAKSDYKQDPTAANEMRIQSSLDLIRQWKANIVKIVMSKYNSPRVRSGLKRGSIHKYGKDIFKFKKKQRVGRKINKIKRNKKTKKG